MDLASLDTEPVVYPLTGCGSVLVGLRRVLLRRCEELQRDIVGIAEGQSGTVVGIDDAAIGNPEFFQPEFPSFKLTPTPAFERQVVQTDSMLAK